jgi:arylsulfatase
MNLDIFPTCLALAQAGPPTRKIDGKNILHLLEGEGASPHKAIFFYRCDEVEAVRAGKWKYHRRRNVYAWPSNLQKKGPWLFDLESDPNERYDLSATYPDIARNMESLIIRWENDMRR